MKNVTILGTEYEVTATRADCGGCLFEEAATDAGLVDHCNATPCFLDSVGNEGRGHFIVVREAPRAAPGAPPVLRPPQPGESVPPATAAGDSWGSTQLDVLAPGTPVAGRKDDSGKLDMTLLDDMPRAIKAVVQVMQWAVTDKKPTPYERGSWLGVHADRYRAAIGRHTRDAAEQASTQMPGDAAPLAARFQRDKETELLHLAHIATSALMALENVLRELEAPRAS
jgi:hypothetical protein